MTARRNRIAALIAVLGAFGLSVLLYGCNPEGSAMMESKAPPAPAKPGEKKVENKAGGSIDMEVYAAPPGVKTDLSGGRK